MPLLFIQNILCFILPLALSFKLLNGTYRKKQLLMENNNEHIRFLLNYWICYSMLDYTKGVLSPYFIFCLVYKLEILCYFAKLWLFYGHGCLVINFCYIDILLRKIANISNLETNVFDVFEQDIIDPIMKFILKRSYPASQISKSLLRSKKGTLSTIFIGISKFQESFLSSPDKSFLLFSLEYICRMDSWEELIQNLDTTSKAVSHGKNLLNYLFPNFEEEWFFSFIRKYSVLSNNSENSKSNLVVDEKKGTEKESNSNFERAGTSFSTYMPDISFQKTSNRKNRVLKIPNPNTFKFKS